VYAEADHQGVIVNLQQVVGDLKDGNSAKKFWWN